MITLHDAIIALDSNIKIVHGDIALDDNGNEIAYDKAQAEIKLAELQEAEMIAWQNKDTAKQSALAKLSALGLTEDEVKALVSL